MFRRFWSSEAPSSPARPPPPVDRVPRVKFRVHFDEELKSALCEITNMIEELTDRIKKLEASGTTADDPTLVEIKKTNEKLKQNLDIIIRDAVTDRCSAMADRSDFLVQKLINTDYNK
jgi:uncharacterized protein YdcH (DUF465 family)